MHKQLNKNDFNLLTGVEVIPVDSKETTSIRDIVVPKPIPSKKTDLISPYVNPPKPGIFHITPKIEVKPGVLVPPTPKPIPKQQQSSLITSMAIGVVIMALYMFIKKKGTGRVVKPAIPVPTVVPQVSDPNPVVAPTVVPQVSDPNLVVIVSDRQCCDAAPANVFRLPSFTDPDFENPYRKARESFPFSPQTAPDEKD